jgi:hypothetical protein
LTLPPEGSHIATFIDYEDLGEKENKFEPGKTQHQLKLTLSIRGDNGPMNQYAWVNASLNEKSILYDIVRALLGKKPKGEVDLDDLKGKSCLVEVEHYESKGKKRSKIISYAAAPNQHGVSISDDDFPEDFGEGE